MEARGRFTKKAVIRDEGYPVGKPAPCHVICLCGRNVPVGRGVNTCETCGTSFDDRGWILERGDN